MHGGLEGSRYLNFKPCCAMSLVIIHFSSSLCPPPPVHSPFHWPLFTCLHGNDFCFPVLACLLLMCTKLLQLLPSLPATFSSSLPPFVSSPPLPFLSPFLPPSLISSLPSPPFHTDASVSQVAIAWLLYQPSVVSVVIGARTVEQLEDNMQSVNLQLSKEEVSPQSLQHNTFLLSTVESLGTSSILSLIARCP